MATATLENSLVQRRVAVPVETMEALVYTDDEMSALPITVFRKSTDSEVGV